MRNGMLALRFWIGFAYGIARFPLYSQEALQARKGKEPKKRICSGPALLSTSLTPGKALPPHISPGELS